MPGTSPPTSRRATRADRPQQAAGAIVSTSYAAAMEARITWRHQQREGSPRSVPFGPDLPDLALPSPLRLWSRSGSYPSVPCEAGLSETDRSRWVLAVMAGEVRDRRNGSAGAGPTLRAEVSEVVDDAWHAGGT